MSEPGGVFVGATTLDLQYLVGEFPTPGTKGPAGRFGISAGGPAANAAATFVHLGGRARLVTEIGRHPVAGAIHRDLRDCGVEVEDLLAEQSPVPMVSAVMTDSAGERTVVASHYPDLGLSGRTGGTLPAGTGVVLVDGFLADAALDAARRAHAAKIPLVLDAGSWKPSLDRLLPMVGFAVCSDSFRTPGSAGGDEVLADLARRGVPCVAITRGAAPIRYQDGGDDGEIPVPQVEVVDTLGAGDVLHGAFCHALASGAGFVEALGWAAEVAAESVRHFGTRAWMEGSSS